MTFMGMRGTGDWVTNQRPENWRQEILYLYPNGDAPLTAMLSMMGNESTDDPHYHWWTENVGSVGGDVAGVFTLPDLSAAYVTGGVTGQTLYITCTAALALQMRGGHQLLLRDASDYRVDVNAKIVADPFINGAASMLTVELLEADDNAGVGGNDLSDCDTLLVIGNINAEGAEMTTAIHRDPTEYDNYTQIFRNSLDVTRTAMKTKLRTGDDYQRMKRDTLESHSVEMEQSSFFSIPSVNVGTNGKPERTTQGILSFVRQFAAQNIDDFSLNATYAGQTWLAGGELWMDTFLEQLFRFGSNEKMVFAGSGAILGINRLAKASGQIQLVPTDVSYGLKVKHWLTPFGDLFVKTHPLFSFQATTRNMMVIMDPKNMRMRFIDDTMFIGDGMERQNTGHNRLDGKKEEYLTEMGYEFHHPLTFGIMNNVGVDNNLVP